MLGILTTMAIISSIICDASFLINGRTILTIVSCCVSLISWGMIFLTYAMYEMKKDD